MINLCGNATHYTPAACDTYYKAPRVKIELTEDEYNTLEAGKQALITIDGKKATIKKMSGGIYQIAYNEV